ncbi:hypothetical protein BH11ARM1_BH11ARM1_07620 [soil metagenome]
MALHGFAWLGRFDLVGSFRVGGGLPGGKSTPGYRSGWEVSGVVAKTVGADDIVKLPQSIY